MFPGDFIDHLTRKGALRDAPPPNAARRGFAADVDWLAATKLTPSTFADELAAFYGCARLQRADLTGGRFAGGAMSPRFLRERRLFPFENQTGALVPPRRPTWRPRRTISMICATWRAAHRWCARSTSSCASRSSNGPPTCI